MTEQQRQFVSLWLAGNRTAVDIYRQVYPSKNGPRSRNGERVHAHRVLHSAPVQQAIEDARMREPELRREHAVRVLLRASQGRRVTVGEKRAARLLLHELNLESEKQ